MLTQATLKAARSRAGRQAIAATLALLTVAAAPAQTLCRDNEQDLFSCPLAHSDALISLCASAAADSTSATELTWLQYRYGRPEKIEFAYPHDHAGSLKAFRGQEFSKYASAQISFDAGLDAYTVSFDGALQNDNPAHARRVATAGVAIQGKTRRHLRCAQVDEAKYYASMMSLATSLSR